MTDLVTIERDGAVLRIGVNRPDKANAWNIDVIGGVATAMGELRDDPVLRAGVLFAHGTHFTGGLDLPEVAPLVAAGRGIELFPNGMPDPWGVLGEPCPKPIVVAVHGRCFTLGIELILAQGLAVAAESTRFAQLEVARGILPLGGATFRLPARLGTRGLRYLLTGEEFDAAEALAIGLVTEVVPDGEHVERAVELARMIATNAPMGVQASLANFRAYERAATREAASDLVSSIASVMVSADAMEGVAAMIEKRSPVFTGA